MKTITTVTVLDENSSRWLFMKIHTQYKLVFDTTHRIAACSTVGMRELWRHVSFFECVSCLECDATISIEYILDQCRFLNWLKTAQCLPKNTCRCDVTYRLIAITLNRLRHVRTGFRDYKTVCRLFTRQISISIKRIEAAGYRFPDMQNIFD